MTVGFYLLRLFTARFVVLLLALVGLLQLVDLLDRSDDILARGLGVEGVVHAALLRLPLMVGPAIPIATLSAALFTFATLAWRSETAALRASGVAIGRLVVLVLPGAVAAAAVGLMVTDGLAPGADAAFALWWARTDPMPAPGKPVWFLAGPQVVGAQQVAADGTHVSGVEIYRRGAGRLLAEAVTARAARFQAGGWVLNDGATQRPGEAQQLFAELAWPDLPPPSVLADLGRADPVLSVSEMAAILRGERVGRDPPTAYRFRLVRTFAQCLVPLVMVLLASPVAAGQRRGGGIAAGMAVGLAAGLSYLVLDGILAALGETGILPIWLAALAAHAVFASLGGALLLRAEG